MPYTDRMLLQDDDAIKLLLDRHHQATEAKNAEALSQVFIPDGFFLGTDDTEKWTLGQLQESVEKSEFGWGMTDCLERHVYAVPGHPDIATFFEVVRHLRFGRMRGTGTVVRQEDGWRIASYVLSFSVPDSVVINTNILQLLRQEI